MNRATMSGHCIESEDFVIVVDKWDASFLRLPASKPHYFFLTHLHADHIKGLTSTWSRLIYTSPFNAWLLPMRRNVKPMLLKELELNVTHTIRKTNDGIAFQVTLLDANHCPGAVMFLFQGKFGNILYTGDFRYTPRVLDSPALSSIIRNKELSVLYLDNTYAAASCKFPSREEALKDVLKIVDNHPDCKILIGMRQLGKEEVLRAVALHVQERVCVSMQRLQILSKLEYEDVFTTDVSQSRIHAVELHTITQRHLQEAPKVVSIKLTSMYECGKLEKQRGNIYVVPYSDHSSHNELMEFVDCLRPLRLYPIVLPKIPKMTADTGPWYRMSTVNCVIPDEMLQLCGPSADRGSTASVSSDLAPSPKASGLKLKFHPNPKSVTVEKNTSNVTYFDEGLNILPFDSLGSHLTNNNKARKHIKASWTRLAPKILSQKGIQFGDSSPGKSTDHMQERLSNLHELGETSFNAHQGVGAKRDNNLQEPDNESEGSLIEVPLSDGDDDLDMPSSARELCHRMELPVNGPVLNGVGAEDRKSECSSELTVQSLKTDLAEEEAGALRRTRSGGHSKSSPKLVSGNALNDSKDSDSDFSSTRRTTRSKSSVCSLPSISRPRTRNSMEAQGSVLLSLETSKVSRATRKSPANSHVPDTNMRRPRSSLRKNGLDQKSISLESISSNATKTESITRNLRRSESKDSVSKTSGAKEPCRKLSRVNKSPIAAKVQCDEETSDVQTSDEVGISVIEESKNDASIKPQIDESIAESSTTLEKLSDSQESLNIVNVSDKTKKGLPNGITLSESLNGIHINSPGRKRLPLSCDWNAAQEIVRKETEQALKALESLNQMKGFRTRAVGSRPGLVALRRLSADNTPPKSPMKNQSLVTSPSPTTGLRSRTASILSSMADTFSKPSSPVKGTKQSSTTSSPMSTRSGKGLSPILPVKETKKLSSPKVKQNSSAKSEDSVVYSPWEAEQEKNRILNQKMIVQEDETSESSGKLSQSKITEEAVQQTKKVEVVCSKKALNSQTHNDGGEKQSENEIQGSTQCKVVELANENEPAVKSSPNFSNDDSGKSVSILNQGIFLTDETLASSSSQNKSTQKVSRKSYVKKQNDLNVDLIRLKVGFAMTRSRRQSAPSKLSSLKRDTSNKCGAQTSSLQSKEKVQDWRTKISLRLRKSPQRRYRFKSPTKLKESAKRALASILRSGKSKSQGYDGDVEDCTQLTQELVDPPQLERSSEYFADVDSCSQETEGGKSSQISISQPSLQKQCDASLETVQSELTDNAFEDSKADVLNDLRRSSRRLKDDDPNLSTHIHHHNNPQPVSVKSNQTPEKNIGKNGKSLKKYDDLKSPLQKIDLSLSPNPKSTDNPESPKGQLSPASRFSNRLSEKTRMILNKGTNKVLAQKSPNILSLMADAFKETVPPQAPTTANILSSMAENFKKLDGGTQVPPSLSIQLISSKSQHSSPKDENRTDWGVQITRVQNASHKPSPQRIDTSPGGSPLIKIIPKSLSIEIIPESEARDTSPRKGPSPPTITICPEVIDLCGPSTQEVYTQSSIHSIPRSPGPQLRPQGGTRWPLKSERNLVQSPPQAVWKEKRGSAQSSDKVIIDIETQEEPQQIPHCPVHCTCGSSTRHGTCMGTMRNLIEEDADCLYEVPLSPEDFESSGAMIALGRGWIESCFEDPEDREEFFQSYEDILPILGGAVKGKKRQSVSTSVTSLSPVPRPSVQPSVVQARPVQNVQHVASNTKQTNARSVTKKQTPMIVQHEQQEACKVSEPGQKPQKRSSTDSERSESLLREIEKKIRAYTDEQSKKVPPRRTSTQSSSSSSSCPKSKSSKRSLSPVVKSPRPPPKLQSSLNKKTPASEKKSDAKKLNIAVSKRKSEGGSPVSGSDSPESKKSRVSELERLTDLGKGSTNSRYRSSVKRSLDHLMTRQKLRSDRRIKAPSSSRL